MPVVFLSFSFGITFFVLVLARRFHDFLHPEAVHAGGNTVAIFVPAFLVGVSLGGMLLGNLLLWLIPPIRERLHANACDFGAQSFVNSMRAALQAVLYIALPATLAMAFLAYAPWEQ
jgi:hypothetical protein